MDKKNETVPGRVHLYWGDGKGKTSAAMGLALRALGRGRRVGILLFLKNENSGEVPMLRKCGAQVWEGKPGEEFASFLSMEEQQKLRERQTLLLRMAAESDLDVLILDEACAACKMDLVDAEVLEKVVKERPSGREIVLTGREPAAWMLEAADYSTQMKGLKHPWDEGIFAREGIEY